MSGQYPPPNPAHPFSRVPVPSQRVMPPWGHTPQPAPGLNMVGSSMNYFGSPHMGLRGTQPWAVPPQSHPKPTETRPISANPLFGLQMLMSADNTTRIPSEYQQEESMDLSSHTNIAKPPGSRSDEMLDVFRNGTITNVNGEVDRTEMSEKESVVTSVIAANPLREASGEAWGESETVIKDEAERCAAKTPSELSFCSVLKTASSILPPKNDSVIDSVLIKDESKTDETDTEVDRIREFIMKVEKPTGQLLIGNYGFENTPKGVDRVDSFDVSRKLDETGVSFLDSSALSVDTDESKLVVAESSAEDIFGISPVGMPTSVLGGDDKSRDSKPVLSLIGRFPPTSVSGSVLALKDEKPPGNPATLASEPEPQPSVENVEILLESMFNSQEENSCSSQTSCGIPQSVIVSGSGKALAETVKPTVDAVSPMKMEDLASTLAEDTPVKSEVKEEKREERITDDVMQEIEKKLEMLTESVSNQMTDQVKVETKVEKESSKSVENVPATNEDEAQPEEISTEVPEEQPQVISELPTQNAGPGSSSNPFIEVENELEKMFAGIVEPVEETCSENQSQNLVSEMKKSDVNKRTVAKRKKANNRRPSDSSVFGGGSSGESTPVKKRGRKRLSDIGNDRGAKKIKFDGETLKKKKLSKDISNELSGKVKGPFVHIEGPKESPSSVVVVNSGVRLDDEDVQKDKASGRRKHSTVHRAEGVASRKAYSSSTLSARYNSESADLSWVCALCHRGPHCEGGLGGEPAGDLFGPYRVPATPPVDELSAPGAPSDRDIVEEQKRRGGKYPKSLRTSGGAEAFIQKMGKKSKRSQSMESVEGPGLLPVEGSYEVWLHSACAEWAPGLCVVGTSLVGLDDAVWTSIRTRCASCGETGAGIGCVVRSCPAKVHYPCALLSGWLLDPGTFIARCHTHRTRLRPS